MFCSNCGAPLPPNGICAQCGVPATNMTFNGHMQGKPVVPQQSFYNPNPMYVQYQGPQQGYGQPFVPQENVAIKGIKDSKMLAGIGAVIKDSSGSMMMVIVSLLTTLALIFSFIHIFYISGNASYYDEDEAFMASMVLFFMQCIPFVLYTIGAWMVTFQGFSTYHKSLYNDNACMHTSGFSTVQAGAIVALIPTSFITLIVGFVAFMALIAGFAATFGSDYVDSEDVFIVTMVIFIFAIVCVLMIIMQSSLISQMSKIKNAIRGRNYENISLLLPVLLFIIAAFQILCLVLAATDGDIFSILVFGIYAIWHVFTGCTLLYVRSRVNNYILGR